ncbi:hypothetical protein DEU56DRAFT_784308 [Suillus clintonianus]|uniref:uncharacterized protein n=1 Tax=Suillus clintonianus TaxID=1904413 RepID=UPI001B871B27|nr:uncharacterized protein DEU56DRAFT_784308 [Suillus clintonianus]KAG2147501.1 hypothetical protein DEU56DRAFT_784308 [Suillus clintonianus]
MRIRIAHLVLTAFAGSLGGPRVVEEGDRTTAAGRKLLDQYHRLMGIRSVITKVYFPHELTRATTSQLRLDSRRSGNTTLGGPRCLSSTMMA